MKYLLLPLVLSLTTNVALASSVDSCSNNTSFNVGAGIYDITGPAAEEGMMGYAMLQQQTAGIYQRLWARAFIIESPCNNKRVIFVNADLGQIFQAVKQQVIKQLQQKYGERYSDQNVLLTATHEHSGPGGYSTYALYNITTLGFSRKNFDTIVEGIVKSIELAEKNIQSSEIKLAKGDLPDINFNRSPTSYLLNPESERQRYAKDVDTEMTLIRFDNLDKQPIGLINWFPIHGVSMNNKNHLINGDNKGLAEYLFEKDFQSDYGPNSFIAAFAQANAGDVSPNRYGSEGGHDEAGLQAVEKAGKPQYEMSKKLFANASELVKGSVDFRHSFIAMDQVTIEPQYTHAGVQKTCPAAIGISMLAGTQDGEGIGKQGISCGTLGKVLPHFICERITTPCQGVKPIAIETGTKKPYPWTPNILPLQIIKVGNVVIIGAPFELTTMTGRRIRETVAKEFPANTHIVISALSNAYSGYVATHEEYQLQRYEGASTHFGPWTEAALQQEFAKLAKALATNQPVTTGPEPLDLLDQQKDLQPPVVFDDKPVGKQFGAIQQDVKTHYQLGETVEVAFWGAHPKNDYHTQDTFLAVQHLENGQWQTIRKDFDWDTEYHWKRQGISYSLITIKWRIPKVGVEPGQYRIAHYGDWKSGWNGKTQAYTTSSSIFTI